MASILDLINTKAGEEIVKKASSNSGEDKEKVTGLLTMALPLLLSAMKSNITSEKGASSLNEALEDPRHTKNLVENIKTVEPQELTNEGDKILNHILGEQKDNVPQLMGKLLKMDANKVGQILKMAAPILMSILAGQKRKDNIKKSGLDSLLASVLGSSSKHDSSLSEILLDKNHDGQIIDDLSGMILGGGNKNNRKDDGLLGGMLGGK